MEGTRIVSTQEVIKTTLAMIIYITELHVIKNFKLPWICISLIFNRYIQISINMLLSRS